MTDSELTLEQFLLEHWLPTVEATVRPSTFVGYRGHVVNYVIPALGRVELCQLDPVAINAFYRGLLVRRGDTRGLSPTTVRRVHATLHRALRDAVRWQLLPTNPASSADQPRRQTAHEMKTWTALELRTFLEGALHDDLFALWALLACTGMRRGEALGLRWMDLDLNGARAAIRTTVVLIGSDVVTSTPKTARGHRGVALDKITIAAFELHAKRSGEARPNDFVFGGSEPLNPAEVSLRFKQLARQMGLPRIRLHDLRHTHASLALEAGIHPKIVSERLGHANIAITLDTYSHVGTSLQHEAAATIERLVFG